MPCLEGSLAGTPLQDGEGRRECAGGLWSLHGERMGWGTLTADTGGELRGDGITNTEATDLQLTTHWLAHEVTGGSEMALS